MLEWLNNFQSVLLSEGSLQCYHNSVPSNLDVFQNVAFYFAISTSQFPSASMSSIVVYSLQDFRIKLSMIIFFAVRAISLAHPVLLDFISLLLILSLLMYYYFLFILAVMLHLLSITLYYIRNQQDATLAVSLLVTARLLYMFRTLSASETCRVILQ